MDFEITRAPLRVHFRGTPRRATTIFGDSSFNPYKVGFRLYREAGGRILRALIDENRRLRHGREPSTTVSLLVVLLDRLTPRLAGPPRPVDPTALGRVAPGSVDSDDVPRRGW